MKKIVSVGVAAFLLMAPALSAGQDSGQVAPAVPALEKTQSCQKAQKADCLSQETKRVGTTTNNDKENLGGKMMLYVTLMILGACAFVWLLFV